MYACYMYFLSFNLIGIRHTHFIWEECFEVAKARVEDQWCGRSHCHSSKPPPAWCSDLRKPRFTSTLMLDWCAGIRDDRWLVGWFPMVPLFQGLLSGFERFEVVWNWLLRPSPSLVYWWYFRIHWQHMQADFHRLSPLCKFLILNECCLTVQRFNTFDAYEDAA